MQPFLVVCLKIDMISNMITGITAYRINPKYSDTLIYLPYLSASVDHLHACPTSGQAVAGSIPAGSSNILLWR